MPSFTIDQVKDPDNNFIADLNEICAKNKARKKRNANSNPKKSNGKTKNVEINNIGDLRKHFSEFEKYFLNTTGENHIDRHKGSDEDFTPDEIKVRKHIDGQLYTAYMIRTTFKTTVIMNRTPVLKNINIMVFKPIIHRENFTDKGDFTAALLKLKEKQAKKFSDNFKYHMFAFQGGKGPGISPAKHVAFHPTNQTSCQRSYYSLLRKVICHDKLPGNK